VLLHNSLLELPRTAFIKNGVTFSGRDDYEAALTDTSHPGHTEANARAKDATNRGEHRDSSVCYRYTMTNVVHYLLVPPFVPYDAVSKLSQ
jgi:hypothetical protein